MNKIIIIVCVCLSLQNCFSQKQSINADYIFDTLFCNGKIPIGFSDMYAKVYKNKVLSADSSVNIKCAKYHAIKSEGEFLKILKRDSTVEMVFIYESKISQKNQKEKIIEVEIRRATYKGYIGSPKLYYGNSEPIPIKIKYNDIKKKWVITDIQWLDGSIQR